jgi:hypothetical protein
MASKAFFFYTTGTNRCAKAEHNGAMTFFRTENNGKNMKKQVEDKVEPSELEPVKRLFACFRHEGDPDSSTWTLWRRHHHATWRKAGMEKMEKVSIGFPRYFYTHRSLLTSLLFSWIVLLAADCISWS